MSEMNLRNLDVFESEVVSCFTVVEWEVCSDILSSSVLNVFGVLGRVKETFPMIDVANKKC